MLPGIESLVPHRGRMLLVDRVVSHERDAVVCELAVRDDPLFCRSGRVGAWLGIEYMAQTVAALIGLRARESGEPVKIGLLLGARRYTAHVPDFAPGDCLRVEASQVFQGDNGLAAFDARVLRDGNLVAEATLSAYQPADVDAFLKGLNE
ncbi:hypothetical protein OPU71_16100 [Niveibacterium sp. 24ML]|uniref:ApeP family dehydratase n=1 Tax=Niveibacterium sp. 24ML TaxID=2985512 RepID=UPI002270E89E|nr:hypothetical protein [Niveibacterium sp. 24ML]MCX9157650.1 hypothetical protein [Niveibacterium sp. 24ML]